MRWFWQAIRNLQTTMVTELARRQEGRTLWSLLALDAILFNVDPVYSYVPLNINILMKITNKNIPSCSHCTETHVRQTQKRLANSKTAEI
jgi:hypothetical protein